MIMMIALALYGAPMQTSGLDAAKTEAEAAKQCVVQTATELAKGSKESAEVLAEVALYRCARETLQRIAAVRAIDRVTVLDTIVKVRMGS
jgi:hypothetical protein